PARLIQAGHQPVFQEAEKRVDRRQPGVASSGCVAPVAFDVLKKSQDHRHIELFDFDLKRLDMQSVCREANEKFEALGICFAGMRAGFALAWQMFKQESTQVWCERGH